MLSFCWPWVAALPGQNGSSVRSVATGNSAAFSTWAASG
jgi:hypothetical protein